MADLGNALMALGLIFSGHTGGHNQQAREEHRPFKVNYSKLTEDWGERNKDDGAKMDVAGFRMQDLVSDALDTKEASLINGLHKLGYLTMGKQMLTGKSKGDIENTREHVGNNLLPAFLAMSGMADLLRASGKKAPNIDIGVSNRGTPMLLFRKKF